MPGRFLPMLVLIAAALLAVVPADRADDKPADDADPMLVTPQREAAALTFARLHHPELEKLLVRLQKQNPREFEKAVRQLYLTSERLTRLQERDPERYQVQLELWKLDSRIRLLAARMTMSSDSALEAKLRKLIEQRLDTRVRQLQQERERLVTRLEKIDQSLATLETDRAATVTKEIERLKKSLPAGKGKPSAKKRETTTQAVSTEAK